MKRINEFIKANISLIIGCFFISSPFLDLVTSLGIRYINENFTLGMIIRFIFLLLFLYYIFFIKKEKRKENVVLLSMIFICFLLVILNLDFTKINIFYEIKVFMKTFYFLVIMICLYNAKEKISLKYIFITFTIYMILIFVPNVFNIGFNSYEVEKVGEIGWFYAANEIGSLMSLLLPMVFQYLFKIKNKIIIAIYLLIMIYTFGSIGTKVPILSLIIIAFYYLCLNFYKNIKEKQTKKIIASISVVVVVLISFLLVIPKTSFYKNIEIHLNYLEVDHFYELLTDFKLVDHFLFGSRFQLFENNLELIDNNKQLFFGIGALHRQCEMDFFDVFINYGVIGLIFITGIVLFLIINEKPKYNRHIIISIILAVSISFFSGHVLVSPSVSIYLAFLILNKVKI